MVFRASSQTLRDLLLGKKGSSKRSSTPRRDGGSRGGTAVETSGFRVVVPVGCRAGQVIRVQGPEGQEVDVTIPENVSVGQAMWVQIPSEARAPPPAGRPDDVVSLIHVLEVDAVSARDAAQQRLLEEMQLQMALWASAEACAAEAAAASASLDDFAAGDAAAGVAPPRQELQVANAEPELSQTQATLLAAAEVGDGAQILAALEEAKKFSMVSISLQEAAKGLQEAEEAMLTWRCLRKALLENDRHEIEVWMEHAVSLGLDVPKSVEKVLEALREQEQSSLESFENQRLLQQAFDEKKRDVEQRLRFAEECGDPDLLAQVRQEARHLGIDPFATKPPPPHPEPSQPSTGPVPHPQEEDAKPEEEAFEDPRSTKVLLEECRRLGLDTAGCQDREDLIRLLRRGVPNGAGAADPPAPPAPARPAPPRVTPVAPVTRGGGTTTTTTVWERQVVPGRYQIHKRYEAMYLLGLDPNRLPNGAELRSAYRRAAMESHPDRQQNHDRQDEAKRLFQRVKDAFDLLNAVVK